MFRHEENLYISYMFFRSLALLNSQTQKLTDRIPNEQVEPRFSRSVTIHIIGQHITFILTGKHDYLRIVDNFEHFKRFVVLTSNRGLLLKVTSNFVSTAISIFFITLIQTLILIREFI